MTAPVTPWYKQGWPWALIGIPGAAVVAGIVMLTLAINGADSLVVGDYYKQGKAINERIARDQKAADLGLNALVSAGESGMKLRLTGQGEHLPPVLSAKLVHIASASLDQSLSFARMPGGEYLASTSMPTRGYWRLHLEDPDGQWRLVSSKFKGEPDANLKLQPRPELTPGMAQ
ncbi:MAG: FixH family protein [Burkholderiaceae bacterium]